MRGMIVQDMFDCIPEIEFNIGYRYFLGNMDNYSNALLSTLKSVKSKLPLLKTMANTKEYEGLRTITQTLRIMFGNIGATGLSEATYSLETTLLNGEVILIQQQLEFYIVDLIELTEHLELLLKNVDTKGLAKVNDKQACFLNYDFTKTKDSIKRSSDYLERKII